MDRPVTYSIGKAAQASELTVKAIRYYEAIGLVPKPGRSNGGAHTSDHRLYTAADLGRLRFIHRARLLGLGLAEIRRMLVVAEGRGCPSRQPEYEKVLKNHLHQQARENKEDDMCEFCGCSTVRRSARRVAKGKPLDVPIVPIGETSQPRRPAEVSRAPPARSHPRYPDRTVA